MDRKKTKEYIFRYKVLYSFLILTIYILGREIPLYGVQQETIPPGTMNVEDLLMQTIGSDTFRLSVFSLGLAPFMISNILVQLFTAIRRAVSECRVSMKKTMRMTLILTLIFAVIQAFIMLGTLNFRVPEEELLLTQAVVICEMIAGAMVILYLTDRNKKYGIGGQTLLIMVNLFSTLLQTLTETKFDGLKIPILIGAATIPVIVLMENSEMRIPLQRVSIHNIYADKNYAAFKLNPIGVMPIMFSAAFFKLPQMLLSGLLYLFPGDADLIWWQGNLKLTQPLGIGVYLLLLYLLTISFAMIVLSPGDLADQLLKNGDSIVNLHAGKTTARYLRRKVLWLSFFSATVMGICVGIPMVLQFYGRIDASVMMLPSTIMMLSGLMCVMFREYRAIRSIEAYDSLL